MVGSQAQGLGNTAQKTINKSQKTGEGHCGLWRKDEVFTTANALGEG